MLSRRLVSLGTRSVRYFGSGSGGSGHSEHSVRLRDKFPNEIRDEDYYKFDSFLVHPPRAESLWTFYSFFAKVPIFKTNAFLNFLRSNFSPAQIEPVSEYYHPPRVTDNSVFIFQSRINASTIRKIRGLEGLVLGSLLIFGQSPIYALTVALPVYYIFMNAAFYEYSRRTVARMDLLPNLESVSVQRIGALGHVYNKVYRIKDLEYVKFDDNLFNNENYFYMLTGYYFDRDLIFRDRDSGDYLLFDNKGYWDKKGLEHALLN